MASGGVILNPRYLEAIFPLTFHIHILSCTCTLYFVRHVHMNVVRGTCIPQPGTRVQKQKTKERLLWSRLHVA